MNIVFLGPPGSGKGTQAKALSRKLGLKYLGTGDLLRTLVAQGDSKALEANAFMQKGELVPDELIVEIIMDQLNGLSRGFILDGFPRTVRQAEILEQILEERKIKLYAVIYFDVPDSESERRLLNRRQCKKCGNIYNNNFGTCPQCGEPLERRQDDEPSTIRRRLEVYHEQTRPLLEFYEGKGLLKRVNAQGAIEEVTQRIGDCLEG